MAKNRFERALGREEEELEDIRRRRREFDPRQATREAARAGYEEISRDRAEAMESLRGRQVGQGRLDTGFGMQDQDRLFRDIEEDFNRQLAQQGLQEAKLNLRNLEGRRRGNRYLDLLSGEREREVRQEGQMWEAIGGAAGTAAGLII